MAQNSASTEWVKSSLSAADNCVEVRTSPDGGACVRSSRDRSGPVLSFTRDEWAAFIGGAQLGEFSRFVAS